jgi:hypothetical protein
VHEFSELFGARDDVLLGGGFEKCFERALHRGFGGADGVDVQLITLNVDWVWAGCAVLVNDSTVRFAKNSESIGIFDSFAGSDFGQGFCDPVHVVRHKLGDELFTGAWRRRDYYLTAAVDFQP